MVIDAITCAGFGALVAGAAGLLEDLLGLPTNLLRGIGIALVPWVAMLVAIARRAAIERGTVLAVVAVNLAWIAGSAILLIGRREDITALGTAFVIVQALVVGLLAVLQTRSVRGNNAWLQTGSPA